MKKPLDIEGDIDFDDLEEEEKKFGFLKKMISGILNTF